MKIHTSRSKVDEAPPSQPEHSAQSARSQHVMLASEGILVAALLLLAAVLRLTLASRGWPFSNSDEATTGLMVDDIIWHGVHPLFTYGEHHVGSLDAYLQVPAFLLFGATNFALHITTTIQMLLFLLVFYGFTRTIYSPLVAGVTLALPLLDSMFPALVPMAKAQAAAKTPRFVGIFNPHGWEPGHWALNEGPFNELPFILKPLEPWKETITVISGLDATSSMPPPGETGGDHSRSARRCLPPMSAGCWPPACCPKRRRRRSRPC